MEDDEWDAKHTLHGLRTLLVHPTQRSYGRRHVSNRRIMLAPSRVYNETVDVWSIVCIFGELLNRRPMFPRSDFLDQLSRVFRALPVPVSSSLVHTPKCSQAANSKANDSQCIHQLLRM
ncbi:putative serine/threonine-protein kinase BUR1 [Phytophthora infestans]|uniref:Putative serine/threonine-protein kinase BUR1 n=1 Tax=Phytophthora infestans TaxID=4787 RepID=A0A8S9TW59_PHYIN|nr:putative serine/threonine-protein kinase BUR1 [Phytophthora infestans]